MDNGKDYLEAIICKVDLFLCKAAIIDDPDMVGWARAPENRQRLAEAGVAISDVPDDDVLLAHRAPMSREDVEAFVSFTRNIKFGDICDFVFSAQDRRKWRKIWGLPMEDPNAEQRYPWEIYESLRKVVGDCPGQVIGDRNAEEAILRKMISVQNDVRLVMMFSDAVRDAVRIGQLRSALTTDQLVEIAAEWHRDHNLPKALDFAVLMPLPPDEKPACSKIFASVFGIDDIEQFVLGNGVEFY